MAVKDAINLGEINLLGPAAKAMRLGDILDGNGLTAGQLGQGPRKVYETVAVAGAACTPSYPILALLFVQTIATGAPAVKAPGILGATPGVGAAAPNAAGTSVVFNAETTGTGTAVLCYVTIAPPKDPDGIPAQLPSASGVGF